MLTIIWLAYLAYPVSRLLRDGSPLEIVLELAALAVFVAAYLEGSIFARPGRISSWCWTPLASAIAVVVMEAIAVSLVTVDGSNWLGLFIFASVSAGVRVPLRWGVTAVGVTTAIALATAAANLGTKASGFGNPASFALLTFGVGFVGLMFHRLLAANGELAAARRELADRAVADERLRFARDLHDLLGHSLSLIAIKVELAARLLDRDPDRVRQELADVDAVTREALREVRDVVGAYREPTLATEVAGARAMLAAAGIDASIADPPDVSGAGGAALGWAVREATTNVVRHSGARRCSIGFGTGDGQVWVVVSDDGGGAVRSGPAAGASPGGGNGLRGLRERIERLGGAVVAGPAPEGGWRTRASVPSP